MIIHNLNPVFVDLGFFQIKWYSLAYIFGIIFGWMYSKKIIQILQEKELTFKTIKKSDFDSLISFLVLGIILGGRLGYVLFYNFEYYSQNYFEIFKLWNGGMSFHGGLIGVIISILIFSKKKRINFFKISDIISCAAPIGIFFGRIANFINGELYGKVTSLPWAVIFKESDNLPRHPSQIYEALLEGLFLFLVINHLALKKRLLLKPGYISSSFLIFYSILRIFAENFREPDKHIGYILNYFSLGFLLSVITLIAGILIIFLIKKNEQNN
tara:strand:+ start:4304 stop:5113 length:810 start_codon:yes stop_codon:yes gene_type:complete